MKLFVKVMLLVLILGATGPFFLKKPDGDPWMSIDDVLPNSVSLTNQWGHFRTWLKALSSELGQQLGNEQMGKTQVYRWQAADGSWRFSDKPPQGVGPQGGVETIFLDPNTNIIEGLPSEPAAEASAEAGAANENPGFIPLPMTVSPVQAQKMMDDARNIQTLMDERSQALDNMTGDSH